MLTFLLTMVMALPSIAPPPAATVWSRQDVAMSAEVGLDTWLVLDTKDTVLVPTALLSLSPEGDLVFDGDASVLTSSYADAHGINHTVTTDCRRYSSAQACADAHAAMVAKMQVLFPAPPH